MTGWIKINRDLMKHWCASDPNFLAVWLHLLSTANFENKKALINSRVVSVKRGQLIYGREAFSLRCGVSVAKLRRIMVILDKEGMINQQKTNKYTMISITNYDQYQSVNQQKTNKQPTNNQQTTTPKESKKVKKEKKGVEAKASCQQVDALKIIELWNNKGLGKLTEVLPARRQKINSRTKDRLKNLQAWDDYFQMFADSHFLSGSSSKWKASFDWALNPTNMMKVIEGNYHNNGGNGFDPVEYNRRKQEEEMKDGNV